MNRSATSTVAGHADGFPTSTACGIGSPANPAGPSRRTAVTRPAISQHLTVLKEAGLIHERREGTRRLYLARPERLSEVLAYLRGFWGDRLAVLKEVAEAEAREERARDK